jgi:hypothetical protein
MQGWFAYPKNLNINADEAYINVTVKMPFAVLSLSPLINTVNKTILSKRHGIVIAVINCLFVRSVDMKSANPKKLNFQ